MQAFLPYAWVLLAFALVFVLVYWYKKTPRKPSLTEQQQRAAQRETRLLNLYQNIEDLMDSFELYVQQQQKDLDRRQDELTAAIAKADQAAQLAQQLADQALQQAQQAQSLTQVLPHAHPTAPLPQGPPALTLLSPAPGETAQTPAARAKQLAQQGLDEVQIAKRMGIARIGVRMLLQMRDPHPQQQQVK